MAVRLALIRDWFIYIFVRLFICLIQASRMETCSRVSRLLAYVCSDILRIRHDVLEDNLSHAYPHLTARQRHQLTRRMWQHLMLMICEIAFAARKIHQTNWKKYITVTREEELVATLLDPRPTVVVTAHFGNFEMAGYVAGLLGFPTFTLARNLDNPFLHAFLNRYRGATGQFILPTRGSSKSAQKVLDAGETLALLGDHYAGPKGCWVEFFGRPASCHKALSLFSLASGAPLVVLYSKRLDKPLKFELGVAGIADPRDENPDLSTVPELTQWYNRHLEAMINQAPEQYWWLHRRWKDPRRVRKPIVKTTSEPIATPSAAK